MTTLQMTIEWLFAAVAGLISLALLAKVGSTLEKTLRAIIGEYLQAERTNTQREITHDMANAGAAIYQMRSSKDENTSLHPSTVAYEIYSAMEAARLSNRARVHRPR